MIEQVKQWFLPAATVVIHTTSGRNRIIRKKRFTIGYGTVNTWNLDTREPPSNLVSFHQTKTGLEVEPTDPSDTLLLDGKPWTADILEIGMEYTLQIRDEQFLLRVSDKPKAWLESIHLDKWLVYEPASGEIFGPTF